MTGRRQRRSPHPTPIHRVRRSALRAGIALAACAALTAGCGALPGSAGGSDGTVTVMTWAPEDTKATNKPGMPALAKAYERWVNAKGGIGGHRLKVLTCNEHNDSVGAADCARRAVKEGVVAVVGSYSQYSRSFLAPLEAEGIPYIGGYGLSDYEFTSPLSYPVNGGQPALMAGNGRQLGPKCADVALVRPDTIAGDEMAPFFDAGLAAAKHPRAGDVRAAEDATEYTAHAEQALTRASEDPGGEGCVTAVLGDRTDTFFDSFRRAEDDFPKVRISSVSGSVDQSVVDRTGGSSGPYEGSYVTGWYPVQSDARWDAMRKVIREQAFGDNRIDPADAGVQTTWIAYTAFDQVVRSLGDGDVTASSVRQALDDGLKVDTGGLTPKLSWRFEDMIAARDFPRLVNAAVTMQVVRDGRLVADHRGFVDVSRTLETSSYG